jgi:hypothetical protein
MTGVEILTIEQVATEFGFSWAGFWVGGVLIGLIFALVFWGFAEYSYFGTGSTIATVIIGFLLGMGCFGTMIGFFVNDTPTAYETQYKVTISDDVPMSEFLEHYEIVGQDGKIFIVREVEQND